jgi:hypothetical protein
MDGQMDKDQSTFVRFSLVKSGAPPGTRTPNPLIKSQLLCLLS